VLAAFHGNFHLPPDLEPILVKALAVDPLERYPSAEDMRADVMAALGGSVPARPAASLAPSTPPPARGRRHPVAFAAAGVLGVGLIAAAVAGVLVAQTPASRPRASITRDAVAGAPAAAPSRVGVVADSDVGSPAVDRAEVGSVVQPVETGPVAVDPVAQAASVRVDAPADGEPQDPRDDRADYLGGELPPALARLRADLDSGNPPNRALFQDVYGHAREHPEDARSQILLAQAFVLLTWYTDAIERYRSAWRTDSASRHVPSVLEDLVLLTFERSVAPEAEDALVEIFGAEALHAVDAAIASEPSEEQIARLGRVRQRLERAGLPNE
jgi:hypothetical protein